jgi:hypothetical protein
MIPISVKVDVPFGFVQLEIVVRMLLGYSRLATALFRKSHRAASIFGTASYWLFFVVVLHFAVLSTSHYSLVEYPKLEKYDVEVYIKPGRAQSKNQNRVTWAA